MKGYLRATFQSLHQPNFRMYFIGQGVSVIGTWMQKVAQAWLVLTLTHSGTVLGVTAALQQLPILLMSFWGGLLADRVDKRKMLLWTQSLSAVPALLLGALTATGQITIWVVLVLALTLGVADALDKPARHTFVVEMAGAANLTNAVALNNTMLNAGKVVGPAVAGVLISGVGLAPSFFINAASFVAVVVCLMLMKADQLDRPVPTGRARGQLRDGLRYVRDRPYLLGPLLLMTVSGTLAYEWTVSLPLLATTTFHGDARVVGLMFAAMGAGAVIGGLAIAGALRASNTGLTVTGLAFSMFLIMTAAAPSLVTVLVLLFIVGAASVGFRAAASSVVQLRSDRTMRGRAMALLLIATGGTSVFGAPLIGWLGGTFGGRAALALGGVATALAAGACHWYVQRRGVPTLATEPTGAPATPG